MLTINFFGDGCFRIKGKKSTIILNPFDQLEGQKMPKNKADIVCSSNGRANLKRIDGEPFVIIEPGEYEVGGVSVFGLNSEGRTLYLVEVDGFRICHLGKINKELSHKLRDEINGVDVLLIPVGGHDSLDAKLANKVIDQIEPNLVVPMDYMEKDLEEFLKLAEVDQPIKETVLKLGSPAEITDKEAEIVILNKKD